MSGSPQPQVRRHWLSGATRTGVVHLILFALFPLSAVHADDPLPIRRVLVEPSQLPAEVRQQQELIAMPRQQFETLVKQANQAGAAQGNPPRLLEARYRAALQNGQLTGAAEWKVIQPQGPRAILPLDPWNLALRGQPLLDGKPAAVGDFEPRTSPQPSLASGNGKLGVLLESAGVHTLILNWSARAERRPEGDYFHLLVPAAPVAVLELELPADRVLDLPAARQSATTVELPADATPAGVRRWQVAFGGPARSELELLVRPASDPKLPCLFVARPTAEFRITLAGDEVKYSWDLEVVHGKLTELLLDWDPAFEPADVLIRQALLQPASWKWVGNGEHRQLAITLPEPIEKRAVLEVSARSEIRHGDDAARAKAGASAPSLKVFGVPLLHGALLGRTVLRIRAQQQVGLVDWQFGHFRPEGPPQKEKDAAGDWETINLTQAGFGSTSRPICPSAHTQTPVSDVTVRQDTWWHVSAAQSTVTSRLTWQVRAGALATLVVELPAGWEVEDLDLSRSELLRDWYLDKKRPGHALVVDLKSAVGPGGTLHLTLRLRSLPQTAPRQKKSTLPIPWVTPAGVRWHEGSLAITLQRGQGGKGPPLFKVSAPDLFAREIPALLPPLSGVAPDFSYCYHGRCPPGALEIEPQAPRLQVQALSDVVQKVDGRTVTYTLYVQALAGSPTGLSLHLAETLPELPWEVIAGTNTIAERRRSAALPPQAGASTWDIRFAQPLNESVTLRATVALPAGDEFLVPLPARTVATDDFEGTVVLRSVPGRVLELQNPGFDATEPILPAGVKPEPPVWRAYHHGPEPGAFMVRMRNVENSSPGGCLVESATLISQTALRGVVSSRYECVVRNPRRQKLTLRLPPSVTLQSLAVDRATVPIPTAVDGSIDLPSGGPTSIYELGFQQEMSVWLLGGVLPASLPEWDPAVPLLQTRRFWQLPRDFLPLSFGTIQPTTSARPSAGLQDGKQPARQASADLPGSGEAVDRTWRLFETADPKASIYCVRADLPHYAGLLAALAVVLLGRSLRHWNHGRIWFLVAGIWLCVLALIWLPDGLLAVAWWPLAAVAVHGLFWRRGWMHRPSSLLKNPLSADSGLGGHLAAGTGATGVLLLASQVLWPAALAQRAADDESAIPYTVYLLASPAAAPDPQTVLVPRRLWSKLSALAASSNPILPDFLIVQADYTGKITGPSAQVEADFQVQLFQDSAVNVVLPLANIRLRDALLDSAPVLAVSSHQPEGIAVSVQGAGRHLIHLAWETPVRNRGDELEIQWTVPPVAASRLSVSLPGELTTARVAGVRGMQLRTPSASVTQLEADLGRIAEVSARWRPAGPAATIAVREAYLVEVQPQEAHVRGALRFDVSHGATTRLRLHIPNGMTVQSVEAKGDVGQDNPPRLQNWSVGPSGELALEFTYPVSGGIRVHLDLLIDPTALSLPGMLLRGSPLLGDWRMGVACLLANADPEGIAASRTLFLPWPTPVNAKRTEAYWAYRAEQCQAALPAGTAAGRPADKLGFARLWPADLGNLTGAQGFAAVRNSESAALHVRPQSARMLARQQLTVGLSLAEADLQAKLELSVAEGNVTFLEWHIPAELTIADVQGSDLLRWNRQGTLLQIWLKRAIAPAPDGDVGTTTLTLNGWLPQLRQEKSETERLALPRLWIAGATSQNTVIELVRRRPMTITPEGFTHLRRQETSTAGDEMYGSFVATHSQYSGAVNIVPVKAGELSPKNPPAASPPATPRVAAARRAGSVRVLLAEYVSQLDADFHAVHEARYTLVHDAGAEWHVALPEGAVLLGITLQDQPVDSWSRVNSDLQIPLPAAAGWQQVSVRWSEPQSPAGGAWVFRPPRLEKKQGVPAVWSLQLPANLQPSSQPSLPSGEGMVGTRGDTRSAAWQCLIRAEAFLKLGVTLAEQWKDSSHPEHAAQMAKALERFYGQAREADRRLQALGPAADAVAASRLAALLKENQRALRETCWHDLRRTTEELVKDLPPLTASDRQPEANVLALAFSENPDQIALSLDRVRDVARQRALLASAIVTLLAAGIRLVQQRLRKP